MQKTTNGRVNDYAINRVHCVTVKLNEPIVCDKPNTLRIRKGKRTNYIR